MNLSKSNLVAWCAALVLGVDPWLVRGASREDAPPLVFEVQLADGSTTKVYDVELLQQNRSGGGLFSRKPSRTYFSEVYTARKGAITFKVQLGNVREFSVHRKPGGHATGFTLKLMDGEVVDFDRLEASFVSGRTRIAGQDAEFKARINDQLTEMRRIIEAAAAKPQPDVRYEMNLSKGAFFYGYWGGRAWCGGAEVDTASLGIADLLNGTGLGAEAPVDSMDEVFQRHDVAYFNAERQFLLARRATGEEISAALRQLRAGYSAADNALVHELRQLPARPRDWPAPPPATISDTKAEAFRQNAITYFRLLGKQFTGTEPAISRRESATGVPK